VAVTNDVGVDVGTFPIAEGVAVGLEAAVGVAVKEPIGDGVGTNVGGSVATGLGDGRIVTVATGDATFGVAVDCGVVVAEGPVRLLGAANTGETVVRKPAKQPIRSSRRRNPTETRRDCPMVVPFTIALQSSTAIFWCYTYSWFLG